jgi:hypothetical protein
MAAYRNQLQTIIQQKNLHSFYPPGSPALEQIVQRASTKVGQLCQRWRVPKEVGNDVVALGLFDIWLYVDDSGSMAFEEKGERITDLNVIIERVSYAATLFDDDGINIRFMNSNERVLGMNNNIRTEEQIRQLMSNVRFSGLTPMGTHLHDLVIKEVLEKASTNQLQKPVLVITVTDGQPAGEAQNAVQETIKQASQALSRTRYGPGAISFQFAQVGNDKSAREFLAALDSDPVVGNLIDCTSSTFATTFSLSLAYIASRL